MNPANNDPNSRPASPAKRSAATMEGAEPNQDKAMSESDPPPYEANQETTVPMGIDEQIKHIMGLVSTELEEGSKGFVVANQWLRRVMARATTANPKEFDPQDIEGEVGKIDNSSVVVPGAFDNPVRFSDKNDLPFVPLRVGAERPADYDILPEEAWNQVVSWYGLAEGQLPVVRFAHNTSPPGTTVKNIVYELNPPVFTIRKVLGAAAPSQSNTSDAAAAVKLVASRTERFQTFLARAKQAAGIPMPHKVRIWRQLVSSQISGPKADAATQGIPSPPVSRATSPSPTASQTLIVNAPTFTKWAEGVDYESVDSKDHTNNEKYDGKATLDILAMITDQTLVLEEQIRGPAGGEFASDSRRKPLQAASQTTQSGASSRRTSPAPSEAMTRGRTRKDGKPRGAIGLTNLGNTCYMNSALQCISRVEELAVYFLSQKHKTEINSDNPLGYNGKIANAYASLLAGLYNDNSTSAYRPSGFKGALSMAQPMFSGYGQQDSQEFLSFLVDALHEDLNRIHKKPYIENPDSDDSTVHDPEAIRQLGDKYREIHTARNDSIAMDLFNGFYKNTMVCPTCEKVSVTFDPYSLLTLQLPIENTWQAKIMFMPLSGYPSAFEIDIDKNAPIRTLKEFFVKKIGNGLTRDRLLFAEMFSHRFYKVMPDSLSISEAAIEARDILCMYELPAAPTNTAFVPKRQAYRSIYENSSNELPDMDSPLAETMAIPILHAKGESRPGSPNLVLNPTFITVTREEAKDYDAIMRRILAAIAPMTSKRFLEDFDENLSQQTTVTNNNTENEAVDVSMQDSSVAPASQPSFMQPGGRIPNGLRSAFEVKYTPPSSEMFGTGTGSLSNVRSMQERVRAPGERRNSTSSSTSDSSRKSGDSGFSDNGRTSSESDEDADTAVDSFKATEPSSFSGDVESEDELNAPSALEGLSAKESRREKFSRKKALKANSRRIRNGRQPKRPNAMRSPVVETSNSDVEDGYYIKLGECIVVDWHKDAFDALFGGADDQGRFTFDEKEVPLVEDQELQAKKNKRLQRKKTGITLDDCFTETGKTEVLSEDNAWYCGRCKELRRASKTLEMWTTPDILVVHLKRFSGERYRRDKVDILVDFPVEGLDLTEKVGCKEDGKEYIYDLFAVDNHYGGLGGGHYTAYAKNFYDGQWYDYNDSSVSRQNPAGVVSTAAYLLFYRRRSSTPLGPPYLQELVNKARNPSDGSDVDDESGEGTRLGDNSSASSRLLGSSNAGAVGAEVAITGTLQQGVNADGPGRGANQAARLMNDDYEDEGVSLDDDLYNDNNMTAVTLHQEEPTWNWDNIENNDTMTINTPAGSDQPEAGSDVEDRFMDFQDDNDNDHDMQNGTTPAVAEEAVDQQDLNGGSNK